MGAWDELSAQTLTPTSARRSKHSTTRSRQEIAQWQKVLDDTRAQKNSLTGDVKTLDAQIKKAQAEIKQRNVTITTLSGDQIAQKTSDHINARGAARSRA
jgi:chromosome segregation ATPase